MQNPSKAVALELIDIGINLTDQAFANDRDRVIEQAVNAGVGQCVVTGTDLDESRQAIVLCHAYPERLFSTAGVHPHYAKHWSDSHFDALKQLASEQCVVAIGETGLDFNRNFSAPEQQIHAFEQQLQLAAETGLPLFLHERDAHDTQYAILKQHQSTLGAGGVMHCFTGDRQALDHYLELGFYIGITGWVCDERRGQTLQALLPHIPLDRLLLETDGPYLLPRTLKPKPKSRRNEPRYLPHICEQIAQQLGMSALELSRITSVNARRLFGL